MDSTVEPLEDNKVKVAVSVDETEFDRDIDAAFKRIAQEVNLPGFRRGKAPRRILEARIGTEAAREEALRESLPRYYARAVSQHEVDVIAAPEIDITQGQEEGPVTFDAVVEVRPTITLDGYHDLRVTVPNPMPDDAEIQAQIDRMRELDATLEAVDRPARSGDHVVVDITGTLDGEAQDGLTADDYSYEVGRGLITPEVDAQLTGAKAGDILEFEATHPDEDEDRELRFRILVKAVQERVLPELTDEWAAENSDHETVAEWKHSLVERMSRVRKAQFPMQLNDKVAQGLADLVADPVPDALVNQELSNRLRDLGMRLQAQGMSLEQYLQVTGTSEEQLLDQTRAEAEVSAAVDLALRAVADAEGIECSDEELDAEIENLAQGLDEKPNRVRRQLERNEQLPAVRSEVRKRKAFDWLLERVEVVDEEGNTLDRTAFEPEPTETGAANEDQLDAGVEVPSEGETDTADGGAVTAGTGDSLEADDVDDNDQTKHNAEDEATV